jgi:glyoxylase-like metal-dependent hydrolase (beta-lactamase superfamily II)
MDVVPPQRWFTVADEGDGITRITEPYVDDLLSANVWHVRGSERDLVVDAGLGVVALRAALPWLFDREPILVLSHAHLDHMGGAHEFAECWVHEAEIADVERPPRTTLVATDVMASLEMSTDGWDENLPELLVNALPAPEYDPRGYELRAAAVTRALHDGDRIDLGDRELTVVHLPGHTPGSIAVYDERHGDLFTGDVAYEGGLIDTCRGSDVAAYLKTMHRLTTLSIRRALPGHGGLLDQSALRQVAGEYLAARGVDG